MSSSRTLLSTLTLIIPLLFSIVYAIPVDSHELIPSTNRMLSCTNNRRWKSTSIDLEDCRSALIQMHAAESQKSQTQRFEFLAPGARQVHHLLPLHTPRIYTTGSCTIAVTMLAMYKPWDLPPDARPGPFPSTEVATLGELWNAAKAVVDTCVHGRERAGWDAEGWASLGIAVTVWQTGSAIDRLVKTHSILALNGSVENGTSEA